MPFVLPRSKTWGRGGWREDEDEDEDEADPAKRGRLVLFFKDAELIDDDEWADCPERARVAHRAKREETEIA